MTAQWTPARRLTAVAVAVVAAMAAVAALAGFGVGDPDERTAPSPESQVVAKGQRAVIDGLTYEVVLTRELKRIAPKGALAYTSKRGVYLIAEFALKNASGGAARAVGEYVSLIGGDGKRYELDEDGSSAYHLTLGPHRHDPALYDPTRPDPIFGFFDVPTGTTRAASVTFDVPRAAVAGARIEVEPPNGSRTRFGLGR
jgi:hypothetical protein